MSGYGPVIFPQHADLLACSAITPDVAAERGYISVDRKSQLFQFKDYQRCVPGLLIPVHDATGAVATWQYRPDKPRVTKAGRTVKYETPGGSRLVIDVPPRVRSQLGDPKVPLWVTEGARKADAAVSAGLCCVALAGVDAWQGTNSSGGKTALADWKDIALNGRRVYLAFDSDAASKPSVAGALERLGAWLLTRTADVRYCYLPDVLADDGAKTGLDDYLADGGGIQKLIETSTPQLVATIQPELPAAPAGESNEARRDASAADDRDAAPGALIEHAARAVVSTGNRNPFDIARDVADHLLKDNEPPRLFAMGTAGMVLSDEGKLAALDQDRGAGWLAYVAERVDFTTTSRDSTRIVAPPGAVMKMLPAMLTPELPPLDGVVTAPYLDKNGVVIATDGYHPGSHLVLRMQGLNLPPVSDQPTAAEVDAARQLLCDEWLGDFPFDTDASRATAIAELLTITGRQFFPLAPLFVNDASASGSGKGLLTTTISLIATGEPPHFMELPRDGDEQRKTITAALLDGGSIIAWDESHIIEGRSLAMILTAQVYSGRLLGASKMISVRNQFTQIALGNNVEVRGDMKRRVMPCRLVPRTEHPEHRTRFRYPELERWVLGNRGALLGAVLTIWRHWDAQGRPEANISMGSYERWGRVIGGALEAAGITDFGASMTEWLSYSEDDDDWGTHLAQLRRRFSGQWFTVSDVADAIESALLARPPVKRDESRPLASQLSYAYRRIRDTPKDGLSLERSSKRDSASGAYTWRVAERSASAVPAVNDAASPDPSPVCSVSPVFAGQSQFHGTGDVTEDLSISSRAGRPSPVMSSDLQCPPDGKAPGQSTSTGDSEHTGDDFRPAENEDLGSSAGLPWRAPPVAGRAAAGT